MPPPSPERAASGKPAVTGQFDGLATVYAAARPDYPDAAMRAVLEGVHPSHADGVLRVLDVGCGTGISARALVRAAARMQPPVALRVEGVEPGADMRQTAQQSGAPLACIHAAPAEHTGLPDHAFDVLLCAQAFHWFDPAAALAEFHRVLRPGGRLALVWNLRAEGVDPLTDAYNRVVTTTAQLDPLQGERRAQLAGPLRTSPLFHHVRQVEFPNNQPVTEESLLARATSASYFPRTQPARSQALAELRTAFRQLAPTVAVPALHHVCQVTLADA
ncbi:MAG: class I SAM-dependent methyltransferase [Phycisphaerales bacterium]